MGLSMSMCTLPGALRLPVPLAQPGSLSSFSFQHAAERGQAHPGEADPGPGRGRQVLCPGGPDW